MQWLIETDIHSEEMDSFKDIIEANGDTCVFGRYVPFEKTDYNKLITQRDEPVMTLGSLQLCRDVRNSSLKIGAYCNLKNLECSSYYPHFQRYLINDPYVMMPYGSLLRSKRSLYEWLGGEEKQIFIRPSSGFKQFTGCVVHISNFEKAIESFGFYEFDPSLMCVVSECHPIRDEYRFFIAGNEIIGSTSYRINGEINHDANIPVVILRFLTEVLDNVKYRPDPIFVIDVGLREEGGLGIIELNGFSASGLYGVDRKFLIDRAREHILRDFEENY